MFSGQPEDQIYLREIKETTTALEQESYLKRNHIIMVSCEVKMFSLHFIQVLRSLGDTQPEASGAIHLARIFFGASGGATKGRPGAGIKSHEVNKGIYS